jgi:hypothetical protein
MMARFNPTTANGLLRIDEFPKLDEAGLEELHKLIVQQKLDVVVVDS